MVYVWGVFVRVDDTWGPLDLVWEWQHLILGGDVGVWRAVGAFFAWADSIWGPEALGQVWEWQHLVLSGVVGVWRHFVCTHSVVVVV